MAGKLIFGAAGALCAVYGIAVLSVIGTGGLFNWFYLCLGAALLTVSALWSRDRERGRRLKSAVIAAAVLCAVIFGAAELQIVTYAMREPEPSADYVILLGTQLRENGPSVDFAARIKRAFEYMQDNPSSVLIATGAQGDNEPMPEAEGARDVLVSMGIDSSRILIEDRSRRTSENLAFSADIIEQRGDSIGSCRVVVVSAEYHLFRAKCIAGWLGFSDVSCAGGRGLAVLMPHFYTREFFALVKDAIVLRKKAAQ